MSLSLLFRHGPATDTATGTAKARRWLWRTFLFMLNFIRLLFFLFVVLWCYLMPHQQIWSYGDETMVLVSPDRLVKLGTKPVTPGLKDEQFIVYSSFSLPASGNFCRLLITFTNSQDLDQDGQNVLFCLK